LEKGVDRDPFAVVRALKASLKVSALHLIKAGFEARGVYLLEKCTALYWAVAQGFDVIVELLLERRVDINVADAWGNTPLHITAWGRRTNIAKVLVDLGAVQNHANHDGRVPLHLACLMGSSDIVEALRHGLTEMGVRKRLGRSSSEHAEECLSIRHKSYFLHSFERVTSTRLKSAEKEADEDSEPKESTAPEVEARERSEKYKQAEADETTVALAAVQVVFEEETDPDTTAGAQSDTAPEADELSLHLVEP
jgi:ankyrin repeat protein